MEEAQKSGIKKQQKFAINLGKGGRGGGGGAIGIGVGIILVGGALTTAVLVANAFQKKKPKPSCTKKNNNKTKTAAEDNLFEKNDTGDKTYDFQSNLPGPHSSSYIHQHLISDGMDKVSESGDNRGISAQNLLPDVKHKFEGSHGKEDLKCDDDGEEEISSCSKDSENQSMECNGFIVETELPERIDGIGKTNADHDQENNSNADTALPCISIQDIENSSLSIEEKMKTEATATETGETSSITLMIEEDPKCGQDDDLLAVGSTEDSKIDNEDDRKSNTAVFMSENEEKVCNHSDGSLTITDQGDEDSIRGINGCQVDVLLPTAAVEVWEAVESVEAPKGEKQPETPCAEEKTAQPDAEFYAAGEVIEDKIHAQMIGTEEAVEEREGQDEVQIDATGLEIDSGSEQTSKLNEFQATVNQDSNHVLLTTADAGVLDAVELLRKPKTENQTNEAVDVIEEKKAQECTLTNATEEEIEEKETQHDVQTDAAGQVILDANDLLEAATTKIQPETPSVERKEAQSDFQINASGEVSEEEKDRHGIQINAAEDSIYAQIIGTEEEVEERGQDEVRIDATRLEIDSGSEQTSKLNEFQETVDQDSNHVLLTTADAGVLDAVELVKAPKTENQTNEAVDMIEENKAQVCTVSNATEEEAEEKETQHDVQADAAGQVIYDQSCIHEVIDADELLEAPKTENQTSEAVEVIEGKKVQDCTLTNATEEEVEEKETEHDVQTDAAGQVILDQGCNHEVFNADELLEAPKTKIQPVTHTVDGKEAQYDVQINAAGEGIEEKKDQYDAQINATEEVIEDKEAQHYSCCKKEKEEEEAQHNVQISAAGEVAEINSGSEQTNDLIELQTFLNQDFSSHISHQMTSENTLPQENEQNISQLNPVTGLKGEFKDGAINLHSSKIKTEFIFSEPSAEEVNGDNPLVQSTVEAQIIHQKTEKSLQESQDKSPTSGAADTIIEDHQVKSISKEKIEVGSRAVNVEKVGESSEGSVDSVQEVLMQVTKEIEIKEQKEKLIENGESVPQQKMEKEVYYKEIEDDAISSKSLNIVNDEKESSNINLLKKYMLKLSEQNDEQRGILMKNRTPIAIGTMSALLCPLCHWYFGLPLVKICLIAVLVMVLSKIQGF